MSASKEYLLHTHDLTVGYGKTPVLKDITFSLRPGQILTLIGPNGAGKSTILKSITRQLKTLSGTVYLDGAPMDTLTEPVLARTMSILMTDRVEPELMTCGEVVSAGRYPYTGRLGILSPEDRRQVWEAMELVHVSALYDRDFNRISDGQRQRVMLARAICQEPQVLVMDEPTSFLDIHHKLELLSILKDLVRQKHLAVVLSLHELDLAQKVSDLILCVREGAVDRLGTPEEIFSGDYIQSLYGVKRGSYNAAFGSLELEAPVGAPQVFVIGGNGSGIPVYRKLQRLGIPFAVGVVHENDLDYPVAKALGVQVISERAFEPISPEMLAQAQAVMARCEQVICTVNVFGTMNRGNLHLQSLAGEKLTSIEELQNDI